jgi:hypothetical protein
MCVCPSSETRRKRDHSEGEKKGENYGVSPFSCDDVDFCAGFVSEQERASERASRARPRMREICFFFVRGTTEGSRRTHILPIRILMRLLLTKKMAGSLRTYCT